MQRIEISNMHYLQAEKFMAEVIESTGCRLEDVSAGNEFYNTADILEFINQSVESVLANDNAWGKIAAVKRFLTNSQKFTCIQTRNGFEIFHNGRTRDFYKCQILNIGPVIDFGVGSRFEFTDDMKRYVLENVNWVELMNSGRETLEVRYDFRSTNDVIVRREFEINFETSGPQQENESAIKSRDRLIDGTILYGDGSEDLTVFRENLQQLMELKNAILEARHYIQFGVNIFITELHLSLENKLKGKVYHLRTEQFINFTLKKALQNAKTWLATSDFWDKHICEQLNTENCYDFYEALNNHFKDKVVSPELRTNLDQLNQILTLGFNLLNYKDLFKKLEKKYNKIPITILNPRYENGVRITGVNLGDFQK